jgi:acetyltransferase
VIADAWQGHGLGRIMMSALVDTARNRGLKTMIGWVLAVNGPMLRLCSELGFVGTPDEDPYTRRMVLDLAAAQSRAA